MKSIGVVTVARSDYSIYLPLLRRIREEPELELNLIVGGMHLSPEFGSTVRVIEQDGFEISERIEMTLSSDTPEAIAKSIGLGMISFAQIYDRSRPDLLVVLGDRFEMYAAAAAALPFRIPVAHIHGGEVTEAAFDDALRHSMTKLSHLHFVSTEDYARRIVQLGEEPWRVTVCGAPSLDNLRTMKLLGPGELEARFGILLDRPILLATFHPVTLEYQHTEWQVNELLSALEASGMPTVFTMPNADTSSRTILGMIREFAETHDSCVLVENLGAQGYFSMMATAAAMVGNSSSGIIEAASFELPVVNIGDRQKGRVRGRNVIDVEYSRASILEGIRRAIDPAFRVGLRGLCNPYDHGGAAERIVEVLKRVALDEKLLTKRFHDVGGVMPDGGG